MHIVQAKSILSANNGMNLYRGCTHGCIYCDSRSLCYGMAHDFTDVEVKHNAPALLRAQLKSKKARCMIGTGSMCDPYQPLEQEMRLTRQCFEIIERMGFGLSVITKSDGILRDLDLLTSIRRNAKCVVQMTLTTADEDLCRVLEPHVATTRRRAETLNILRDAGIPTIVWLSPFLPFLNDTRENIARLLDMCEEARVYGVICFGIGLTLRDGNREYFYEQLDEYFPGLKRRYIQTYQNAYYVPSPDNDVLMAYLREECAKRHILQDNDRLFRYMRDLNDGSAFRQLSMFDDNSSAK